MIWNTFPLWNSVKFLQFTVDSKGITSFHKIFRGEILLPLECKFWFVNILLPFLRDGRSWRYLCLNPCLIFINPALSPSHACGRPLSWRSLAIASDLSLPLRFCSEKWTSCQAWPGAHTAVWGETPPHLLPPPPIPLPHPPSPRLIRASDAPGHFRVGHRHSRRLMDESQPQRGSPVTVAPPPF